MVNRTTGPIYKLPGGVILKFHQFYLPEIFIYWKKSVKFPIVLKK